MSLLQVGEVLVQEKLARARFACNLHLCAGACCVEGDDGAPVTPFEVATIREILDLLTPYTGREYDPENISYMVDGERHLAILPHEGPCIFAYRKDGGWSCSIDTAREQGRTEVQKPLSCHLFPLLLLPARGGRSLLKLETRSTCDGCHGGGPLVVDFLKTPLIRAFGDKWYQELRRVLEFVRA